MAEKKLTITFELDTKTFQPKLVSSTADAQKFTNQMKKTAAGAKQLQAALTKMGTSATPTGKGLGDLGKQSNQTAYAVLSLNRVVSDAPFGFIAISNNIEPLLQSFRNIQTATGTFGSKLKVLLKSFAGPNGLMFVLSLATSAATFFALSSRGASKEVDKLASSVNALKEAADKLVKIKDPLEGYTTEFSIEEAEEAIKILEATIRRIEGIPLGERLQETTGGLEGAWVIIEDIGATIAEWVDDTSTIGENTKRNADQERALKETLEKELATIKAQLVMQKLLGGLGKDLNKKNKKAKEKSLFLTDAQIQAQLNELEALKETAKSADELFRIQEKITKVIKERERFRPEVPIEKPPEPEPLIEVGAPLEELPEDEILPDETFENAKFKAKVLQASLVRVGDEFINLAFKGKFAIESLVVDIGKLISKMLVLRGVETLVAFAFPGLASQGIISSGFAKPEDLTKARLGKSSIQQAVGAGGTNAGSPILKPVFIFKNLIKGQDIVLEGVRQLQGELR